MPSSDDASLNDSPASLPMPGSGSPPWPGPAPAGVALWQHDTATGLVHSDAAGWALLGLPPAPQGLPLATLIGRLHPDDRASIDTQWAAAQAQPDRPDARLELGARCRHADGRWRHLLYRWRVRRNPVGQVISHVGVALDLSERFDLQQGAQRLELATAAAGVGLWSGTVDDRQPPHWDAQMRRMHDWGDDTPPPLPEAYLQHLVHPEDRATVADSLALLAKRRQGHFDLDLRIVLADGRQRRLATRTTITTAGGALQLHGVMLDVTDRHLSEDRLREANERSALATRGAGIGTWESDAGAQAGWWDAQMFHLRGLPPEPALVHVREMLKWLHPEDRAAYQRGLQDALAQDAPYSTEFRIVRPDGQVRWLISRSMPVRNEQGLTVRRIGINWDNTDAHLAAQAREERQLALRESQAKSRALARISHELRTPLNAVLGISQLLLSEGPDPATWRERLGHVQRAGQQLLKLVNDVLELSGRANGELPQPVAQTPPQPGPQASVLYIEDNEVNLLIVEALMRQRPDLRFLSACDGHSGVAVAQAERPSLILLDMQLPDIDGGEVLRRLRADPATAAIHCIALSANAVPEDIHAALAAGFDAYWTKPLDMPAFLQSLAQRFGPAPR